MKYKNIPSMAHNFAHSFLSGMHFVENTHLHDELYRLLRQLDDPTITMNTKQIDIYRMHTDDGDIDGLI
jgi:hypothetical protein